MRLFGGGFTEKFIPFIMCVFFILFSYVFYRIIRRIITDIIRKKIRRESRLDKKSTLALLCTYFPPKYIIANVLLPHFEPDRKTYVTADAIIVTRTYVVALTVERRFGRISTEQSDVWSQSYKKNGVPSLDNFENPIPANEMCGECISQIFAKKKIEPPRIYNFVIFSTDRVAFDTEYDNVYALSDGIKKLRKCLHGKKYSRSEQGQYMALIKAFSAKARREVRR